MPYLRCPSCLASSQFKADIISEETKCPFCETNLFDHYYKERSTDEIPAFIKTENDRLKKIKQTPTQTNTPAFQATHHHLNRFFSTLMKILNRFFSTLMKIIKMAGIVVLLILFVLFLNIHIQQAIQPGPPEPGPPEPKLPQNRPPLFGDQEEWWALKSPESQRYLHALVTNTERGISSGDNPAKVKQLWINANKELCGSGAFAPFEQKKDWVGRVKRVSMSDSGEKILLEIEIQDEMVLRDGDIYARLHKTVLDLKMESYVRFSGTFRKGDMSENECLNNSLFDSSPELVDQDYFFKFKNIAPL